MKSLDIKIAYLNENFKIVNRNKEFYSYFENVGIIYTELEDLVSSEHKKDFVDYVKNSEGKGDFHVYNFKKNSDEYVPNIVSIGEDVLDGKTYKTVHIIDISNAADFFRQTVLHEKRLNYALGITNEYFFFYQKSTNIIKIHNFMKNEKILVYNQDIDSWKSQVIFDNLIEQKDIIDFETKINELKECNPTFSMTVTTSLRFTHSMFEKLVFKAVRMEDKDDVYMVGRILPEISVDQTIKSTEIIEELKIDSLTGVYNKKVIMNFAEKRFSEGTKENAMVVIVDLDHFKPVNDAYGHLAGDKVLKKAGEVLKNIVGETGVIGRYGGDEFLLILEDMNDELTFRSVFRTINADIKSAFAEMFPDIKVTASIGASLYPKDGNSFDELFKKADFCLYRAKDKGRDRYVFFREDLHGELYKKASEAKTEGIKYDVREVQELKSMADFLMNLGSESKSAVKTVLNHMLKTYNLTAINFYYGPEMKRIYCTGFESEKLSSADYVYSEEFKKAFGSKTFIRVDFTTELPKEALPFGKLLEERGIKSSIQCVLGSIERPLGLVSFDRLKEAAQWAEYETNCCIMFGAALNLLCEDKLKNLFS